ncbi:MAG: hypothetical protein WCV67_12775, partial [Victivallaceae bacterium]
EKSKKSCERWKCRTRGQNVRNDCKTEMPYAQRHSKVSESDGCPSGYAGRMGETVSAQRHSKVSESDGCPKCTERLSKIMRLFSRLHKPRGIHRTRR